MHTFDSKTGFSCFEFAASPHEQVFLVGDFNHWQPSSLRMKFLQGRWRLCMRLAAGRHKYAFQFRDGFYGGGVAHVPLHCSPLTEEWLLKAATRCTCGRHFWKWN